MSELSDLLKRLEGWDERPICELCGANGPFHMHHKTFRSQGGPDTADNLARLCVICHGAVHGIPVFQNGRSCESCHVLKTTGCYFGEVVTKRPVESLPPWEPRSRS